jgi:hypothetical protein
VASLGLTVQPAPPAHAATAQLQAVQADSVVDGFGVNIHLPFLDTPYADADAVAAAIQDLGVRHVRDELRLDNPRQYAGMAKVRAAGARFDLIMGRPDSGATPADYVRTVAELPPDTVESLEGANEWDLFGPADSWVSQVKDWQHGLYAAADAEPRTADLPVLSPALAFKGDYATAGDLSADQDVANAHMYPGGAMPSSEIDAITQKLRASIPTGPLVTTEAGYHDATAYSANPSNRGVPEDVAGAYLPRLLLEHLRRGEQRMYGYELIDSFDNPDLTDPEAHFGLLRHDLTPKPAYTAMKNLMGLLTDPGPAFTPGSLQLDVAGFPGDGRYLLTQKRDGELVLLLWRNVSLWDQVNQQPQTVAPVDVTFTLPGSHRTCVFRPTDSADPVQEATGSTVTLPMDGAVSALAIDPSSTECTPAPQSATATAGNKQVSVSWRPVAGAQAPGYRVTRQPDCVTTVVSAATRSYVDKAVTNGKVYSYAVRTLTSSGASAPAVTQQVVPGRK